MDFVQVGRELKGMSSEKQCKSFIFFVCSIFLHNCCNSCVLTFNYIDLSKRAVY